MDYFLSFPDEAAATAVLYTQEPTEWDNTDPKNPVATAWEPRANYMNISTIGTIYKPTGETDAEGSPVMAPIPSWHVNIRLMPGENAAALEPFAVTPKTPVRVWAG